ncbi:MAG TPA: methyltransferase domain-containing protein [Solirubrobacterales bacterium]|nr:methyltransferase domain-containing protein [Solirubrobacterales bacterium]
MASPSTLIELRRRIRVGWGLRRIAAHERVGERTGRRLTTFSRRWAIARATRRVAPLQHSEGMPERSFRRYARGGSAVRIARLLDLVPPRSRIVDIGIGHGYVAGVLLRDLRPEHYCGVELRRKFVDHTRAVLAANELDDRAAELVVGDIFELDERFWRDQDPDFVLLLEVLEHLDDPGAALRAVAGALRPPTRLLLTVPLNRRLERVWGHRSIFDRRRLERLCAEAGLVIERAEPVQSTWSLILATPGGAPVASSPAEPDPAYTFTPARVADETGVIEGAARVEVANPRVIRLDVGLEPAGAVRRLRIEGRDGAGHLRLEWAGAPAPGRRATYVLRPGERAGSLAAIHDGDPEEVTSINVVAEPRPGTDVAVAVNRAAYVGRGPASRASS